jgi:cell pole-organizing protein PopZ
MADKTPDQEPSIEEILASIRQIISDDDETPAPAAAPAPAEEDDGVLELTEVLEEEPIAAPPEPDLPPPPRKIELDLRDAGPEPEDDNATEILTDHAANAALQGFMRLSSNTPIDRAGNGQVTLEDIVRDLMRPMLRDWLDRNLPPIIEKVVEKELDKLARKALND